MSSNHTQRHTNVGVVSVEAVEAPEVVTSAWIDEQLAEVFERCNIRPGLLEEIAGITERRWWPEEMRFDTAAALAGEQAIVAAGIDRSEIGMLISTSVCRHHLEPSVACAVHHHLGLAPGCLNFDLGNACLGFVNAIHLAATSIDAGQIEYALIVDGEGARQTHLATIARLKAEAHVTADVYDEFASLTLGSGAAAMVLGSLDASPQAHRLVGGVSRAATQHHDICVGDLDRMRTDTKALLEGGLELGRRGLGRVGRRFRVERRSLLVRHPPGQQGAHEPDVRDPRDRRGTRAADLPDATATSAPRRSRSRLPGCSPRSRPVSACSAWGWDRA